MLLASVPDPDSALHFLERLHQEAPSAFDRITSSPAALRYSVAAFSYSNFLSESILRNPEWVLQVSNSGSFYRVVTADGFDERLVDFLGAENTGVPAAIDLARYRRRRLLRIMLRDVLDAAALSEITEELSNLADAILDLAYRRIRARFVEKHGEPRLPDGQPAGFSVLALGKLGGRELNYSSDIDLMFVYGGNGMTDGVNPISNKEFFKKVANEYTALLSTYTADGLVYRVDLRLRPDGTLGEICISLDGARTYYAERARDWEKQMLIKARVAAGEPEPGVALLEFVEPLIYQSSLDFHAVEAVSETRQRISEKMAAKRGLHTGLDIKLMTGGIRDIEFLVQCLQRLHGGREQWVRHGGTMFALFRLRDKDLLSDVEYARLAAAYQFLRQIEHRLQIVDDRQTHTLPTDAADLDVLARKLTADAGGEPYSSETMLRKLEEHRGYVREIYERVIHAQKPMYYTIPEHSAAAPHAGSRARAFEQPDAVPGSARPAPGGGGGGGQPASRPRALRTFSGEGVFQSGPAGAPGWRPRPRQPRTRPVRTQRPLRRSVAAPAGTARRAAARLLARARRSGRRLLAAALLPSPDVAHTGRERIQGGGDLRDVEPDLGAGRHGARCGVPDRAQECAAAGVGGLLALQPDDGGRARPARHARIRPGVGRRPGVRDSRRRRSRAVVLDGRGRTHHTHGQLLYRRRRDVHHRYAPASRAAAKATWCRPRAPTRPTSPRMPRRGKASRT